MSLEVAALRALAHPVRLRILSLLAGSVLSASEVSRELGISQANASYHLRTLASAGMIVEAEEEVIRGGVAKRYAYLPDDQPSLPRDAESQVVLFRAAAEELVRRGSLAQEGGEEVIHHFTDAELWVDTEDWEPVMAQIERAMSDLHRRAYPPRTPGTIPVSVTVALFRMRDEQQSGVRRPRA